MRRPMHMGNRKLAHVVEFEVFPTTVFRGGRGGRTGWRLSWDLVTLVIASARAGLDEWHQSFVSLRQVTFGMPQSTPSAHCWLR